MPRWAWSKAARLPCSCRALAVRVRDPDARAGCAGRSSPTWWPSAGRAPSPAPSTTPATATRPWCWRAPGGSRAGCWAWPPTVAAARHGRARRGRGAVVPAGAGHGRRRDAGRHLRVDRTRSPASCRWPAAGTARTSDEPGRPPAVDPGRALLGVGAAAGAWWWPPCSCSAARRAPPGAATGWSSTATRCRSSRAGRSSRPCGARPTPRPVTPGAPGHRPLRRLRHMRADMADPATRPDVAVIQFTGNNATDCIARRPTASA